MSTIVRMYTDTERTVTTTFIKVMNYSSQRIGLALLLNTES